MLTQISTDSVTTGVDRAIGWLRDNQNPQGYWVGQLQSNATMEAEWVLAMHFLGITDDPKYAEVVRCIRSQQRADGAWEVYSDAPHGDLNATVECYAALRASGMPAEDPSLVLAREWILEHGGLSQVRVFTKMWLALIGEWPWSGTPTLPPEIVFFPRWFPFSLYEFSSWARATIVPLCILSDRRPVRPLAPDRRLDELHPGGRAATDTALPKKEGAWEAFFHYADRALSTYVNSPLKPGREVAIKACLEWILSRQEADGCWAGIQPPWIYSIMALHTEGYALDHPVMAKAIRCFDEPWAVPTEQGTFLQACTSPVWDTLLSQLALLDCEHPLDTMFNDSLEYILGQQIRVGGDWQETVKGVRPGGWAFEYENDKYPDVDDTAVALIVLARLRPDHPEPDRLTEALERALEFVLGLQCRDGGWGAFDRDNDSPWVCRIPFCDFGEALDPPSVDVTAHVVEALGCLGRDMNDPIVARAVRYMRSEQESEGSWFGRWGVNHIYGTGAVLPALEAVGENMSADYVQRACRWLVAHQNPDGGWGESCASYMDDSLRGKGESTASQTAWALMGLLAAHQQEFRPAIEAGVGYLLETQTEAGSWKEAEFTGTGFPGYGAGARTDLTRSDSTLPQGTELSRGFMLRYHMYRHYFPMMALGRARRFLGDS